MSRSWTSRIAASPNAPATARTFVEDCLQRLWSDARAAGETWEDAVVIVSELVTNAVQAATAELRVDLAVDVDQVEVAVTDEAVGMPTITGPAASDQPYGRGLAIVAALSKDWGVVPVAGTRAGKTVWARLDVAVVPDLL